MISLRSGMLFFLAMMGLAAPGTEARGATSVSQHGITFTFSADRPVGQFANGDYWVVAPVTITSITPAFDGANNGWEVNPVTSGSQGFDSQAANFSAALVKPLPYTAQAGQSIVKTTSSGASLPAINTAAVLTVVAAAPPGGGADVFRPPYVGAEKPYYYVSALHLELLPTYAPVAGTPTLTWLVNRYQRLQMDHKEGLAGRQLHPETSMPNYGSDIAMHNNEAALRLMLNDTVAAKRQALINYVQYGIDIYQMAKLGKQWSDGGGHRPGQKLPMAMTAILLDDPQMQNLVRNATIFHEDQGVYYGAGAKRALYGFKQPTDEQYWNAVVNNEGFKSFRDPYGYIDGGAMPGGSYQYCCVSQPWKGSALALHMMPILKTVWNNPLFFEYVDRWVTLGAWTQPDPAAPSNGSWSSYRVKYGADGHGGYIADTNSADGVGRFPDEHGASRDSGYFTTDFQRAMWTAYRYVNQGNDTAPPTAPIELDAAPVSAVKVHLTWSPASDDSGMFYYCIQRDGVQIKTVSGYELSCDDTGLSPATQYVYTVTAMDTAGNESDSSPAATVETMAADSDAPSVPTGLAAQAFSARAIMLRWNRSSDNQDEVSHYRVFRAGTHLGDPAGLVFTDSCLAPSTAYQYTVSAVDQAGNESAPSEPVSATTKPAPPQDPALALAYSMNEGAGGRLTDLTANCRDGIVHEAQWASGGMQGSGLGFDGVNDYIDLGTIDFAWAQLTIAMWFKVNDFDTPDARLISKSTGTAHQDHYWMISTIAKDGTHFGLRIRLKTASGGTTTFIAPGSELAEDTWTHAAMTYDGATVVVYQDGVDVGRVEKTGNIVGNASVGARLGLNPDGYGAFSGMIDEVRIFNRALRSDEIVELMNATDDPLLAVGFAGWQAYE